MSKGQQGLRESREGLEVKEKESKASGSRIIPESSKYSSQKTSTIHQKEVRNPSRSKDKPYILGHYTDANDSMMKKNDSFYAENKKNTNSRDNLRSINQAENSLMQNSFDKNLPKDNSNRNFHAGLESRLYKADAKNSALLNSNNSRKLLNSSGDRSMLKNYHDDKENKQRLANKEKYETSNGSYYSKYLKQASDCSQSRDYEGHSHSMAGKPQTTSGVNSSLEALKNAYHKYEQQNRSSLIKTASTQLNTSGSGPEKTTYNVLGSRILKKLKKNGPGPSVNPEQILKSGGVYENRYLYNAILNSSKSRAKLPNNPFKVIE
jgi:hypothetical protein